VRRVPAGLSARERAVVDELARREDELVALLVTLIGFDTRAPDPDYAPRDEAALQAHLAARLEAAGLEVRLWEPDSKALPTSRYVRPPGHTFAGRPQLAARRRGRGGGRSLLLNGHVDVVTVEPREEWTSPPLRGTVREGRVYGRGACDMKGGVAAMVVAAEALSALDVPLRGDLVLNTVTDEESTGLGSLASVDAGVGADGGVIPEPTSLQAWLGARGSLMPRITVEGRAGHAGYPPDPAGPLAPANAIEKMQVVLAALEALRDEWQARPELAHAYLARGSIVPTALQAGEWMVAYPARCTLDCHVQYLPQQADAGGWGTPVEAEIEARVAEAAAGDPWLAAHPPRLEWPGDVPPGVHAPDEPLPATVLDAMAATGVAPEFTRRTTWFDGPTFSRAGTPTIAFGPGDIRLAHAPDEHVPVAELVRAAQVLAVAAMRFCGVAPD
jgi:acetylornithine deacetylase